MFICFERSKGKCNWDGFFATRVIIEDHFYFLEYLIIEPSKNKKVRVCRSAMIYMVLLYVRDSYTSNVLFCTKNHCLCRRSMKKYAIKKCALVEFKGVMVHSV